MAVSREALGGIDVVFSDPFEHTGLREISATDVLDACGIFKASAIR